MKNTIVAFLISITIVGCKDKEKKEDNTIQPNLEENTTEVKDHTRHTLGLGCYVYNANGNDFRMKVSKINGDSIMANLYYTFAEKDKNEGTFKGNLIGDKLIGKYIFKSEGKESVRDVAFRVEKNQIVEGFGDLNEGGTKFKDTTNITYSTTTPWTKADCN
jgi:hypothetical protein